MPILTVVSNGMIATLMSPALPAAFFSVSSKLCAAFFSSVILLLEDIDPVLSSASASSSFLMPQSTCELTLMFKFCCPNTFVKVVATCAGAGHLELEAAAAGVVNVGVMRILVTSVRLNRALKYAVAF